MKKALILCPEYPYPTNAGDKISTHGYIVSLKRHGYAIEMICFANDTNDTIEKNEYIDKIYTIKKPPKISLLGFIKFLGGKSYLLDRYYTYDNKIMINKIIECGNYDIVLAIQLTMGQYIADKRNSMLSTEVLYGRAFCSNLKYEQNILKKIFYYFEKNRVEKAERIAFERFKKVIFYSHDDIKYWNEKFKKIDNFLYLPLGLDLLEYPLLKRHDSNLVLGYYGNFTWFPTADGLRYLLNDIWPKIEKEIKGVKLKIAGRGLPNWAYKYENENCEMIGEVKSMQDFVESLDIVLAPVRVGGGIRLKILEAMAWGRPVIATNAAMEGNDINKEKMIINVADKTEDYVDIIKKISTDEMWNKIVNGQRDYIERCHNALTCLDLIYE